MTKADVRRKILNAFMEERGLTVNGWAKEAGVPESALRGFLSGRTQGMNISTYERLADQAEVTVGRLIGDGDALNAPLNDPLGSKIPEVDVRAGMGGGGVYATEYNHTDEFGNTTSADNVKAVWSFPTAYVRDELRSPAAKVWLLEVKGDSMEPTLRSGDRVMVDTSDITPSPGGVFALYDGLSVVVKRLHHVTNSDPATVRVISDNPKHGEETHPLEDIKVIGRVVWFGRRL